MITPSLDVFRHQPYRHYWAMRQSLSAARQMQAVAIGWQVYDVARQTRSIEESALMLGLVGLAQFAPVFLLSLVGGQAADRLDRKLILVVTNLVRVACALILAISPFFAGATTLWLVFSAAILLGCMHAFSPAAASVLITSRNSAQVLGGVRPFSSKIVSLYQMVLVTSSEVGIM